MALRGDFGDGLLRDMPQSPLRSAWRPALKGKTRKVVPFWAQAQLGDPTRTTESSCETGPKNTVFPSPTVGDGGVRTAGLDTLTRSSRHPDPQVLLSPLGFSPFLLTWLSWSPCQEQRWPT